MSHPGRGAAPVSFRVRSGRALADDHLRVAVAGTTGVLAAGRLAALDELADPDGLRDTARALRRRTIGRLDELLGAWEHRARANGIQVHRAPDATAATAVVCKLVERAAGGSALVAKGKSMASEEIGLNAALEQAGHRVVETDLGEFIVQLAGEAPSHLIVPAIHKDRHDVAELFSTDAGRPVPPEVPAETAYARQRLRAAFLAADVGITGVNFAVADTGSICLVENEGNGRMCSTLPRVHVAIMGAERVVADWDELDVMLALLGRSATGQAMPAYTNLITGPRRPGEADGPDEVHVVVVDNGRRALLGTSFEEALDCIRCGACLNVCPVYRHVGGHTYDSVYPGPIGAVLTPLLAPSDPTARELARASTLCAACTEACPVRIPLHDLLVAVRQRDATDNPRAARLGLRALARLWSMGPTYRASTWLGGRLIRRLPGWAPGWAGAWRRVRAAPRRR